MQNIPTERCNKLWHDIYLAEYISSGDSSKARKSANIAARALIVSVQDGYGRPNEETKVEPKIKEKVVNKDKPEQVGLKPGKGSRKGHWKTEAVVIILVGILLIFGLTEGAKICKAKKAAQAQQIQQELIQ